MCKLVFSFLLLFAIQLTPLAQETPAQKYLISVERIWDRAPHSAFTDLIEFKGKLYCTFREGSGHVPGKDGANGTIRVIASDDGQNWRSVALLSEEQVDLRDPKLSVTPDRRLMLLVGGSYYEGEKPGLRQTRVSFSDRAGTKFSVPKPIVVEAKIKTDADWLWRVTWHRGTGYGVIYQSGGDEYKAHLVSTRDGISYQLVTTLAISGRPNETTLRFTAEGEMIAWVRRERESQYGFIGTSRAPYKEWSWKEQNTRLGGPNFVVLPNGKMIGVTRGQLPGRKTNTYVAWLQRDGAMMPIVTLPSGGDTSYAGLALRGERLLVSYYASHEGKSAMRLLRRFIKLASREPVPEEAVAKFEQLTLSRLHAGASLADALLSGYKAFLCSDLFLYLREPARNNPFAIANRLSHFLTDTRPDAALLARQGKLRNATVLRRATEGLLASDGFSLC